MVRGRQKNEITYCRKQLNEQGKCRLWRQGSPYDKVYVAYLVVLAAIKDRTDTHETVMRVLKARIQKLKGEI